jgi:hypothetical protein
MSSLAYHTKDNALTSLFNAAKWTFNALKTVYRFIDLAYFPLRKKI